MKKIIILLIVIMGTLTGCVKDKKAITAEEFTSKMEEKGFEVVDRTAQLEYIQANQCIVASNDDYQLYFYVLYSEEDAMMMHQVNKQEFKENKGKLWSESDVNINNYNFYSITSNGMYSVISRVSDTLIYAEESKEKKGEIKSILKELGY